MKWDVLLPWVHRAEKAERRAKEAKRTTSAAAEVYDLARESSAEVSKVIATSQRLKRQNGFLEAVTEAFDRSPE